MSEWRIIEGDCRQVLAELPSGVAQTCVTSPPYYGLRDYGHGAQIGLEATPDAYVTHLVAVFREVKRVLRDDGTVWLNLGDSYAAGKRGQDSFGDASSGLNNGRSGAGNKTGERMPTQQRKAPAGMKPKDLLGIPWMVAFALRADGWFLRSDIIWAKPNPMPESVTDRPTKAHEYLFLLSKGPRYVYDADAIREVDAGITGGRQRAALNGDDRYATRPKHAAERNDAATANLAAVTGYRNKRSVWTVATQPYSEAHFATFPPKLIEPCVLAGSREGDIVLDPFNGAGTTGLVAIRNGRSYVGIELNPEYAAMTRRRLHGVPTPLPGMAA